MKLPEQEQINQEVGVTPDENPMEKDKQKKKQKDLEQKERRLSMIKKLVLLKKRQAVNQGAGADVTV